MLFNFSERMAATIGLIFTGTEADRIYKNANTDEELFQRVQGEKKNHL
jgi:hypothetical protein